MFTIGKLRPLPQRKVIEVLGKNGFKQVKVRKHITFKKVDADGKVWTTWVPLHYIPTTYVNAHAEGAPFEFYDLSTTEEALECADKIIKFVKKVGSHE